VVRNRTGGQTSLFDLVPLKEAQELFCGGAGSGGSRKLAKFREIANQRLQTSTRQFRRGASLAVGSNELLGQLWSERRNLQTFCCEPLAQIGYKPAV